MSIMVEKVARALTEVQIRSANELFKLSAPRRVKTEEQIVSSIESGWRMNQKDARAAIEAMREPTKEMCEAAPALPSIHAIDDLPLARAGYRPGSIQNLKRWQAMVDVALITKDRADG